MQIPQVTAQSIPAESKIADGDQPSTKTKAGEKGAFAILLALLQGTATSAQSESVTAGTESTDGEPGGTALSSDGTKSTTGSSISQTATLLVNGAAAEGSPAGSTDLVSPTAVTPATETRADAAVTAKQTALPVQAKPASPEPSVSPGVPVDAAKTAAPVEPLVVTEVVTPVATEKPAQTSSARYIVPTANPDGARQNETVKPAASATVSSPNPVSEAGIPVSVVAGDDTSEPDGGAKQTAPADDGIEPEVQPAAPRSTARVVVAKAGTAGAESQKAGSAPPSTTLTPKLDPETANAASNSAKETLEAGPTAANKQTERVPVGNAGTTVSHADGVRPATTEVTQTAPVQAGQSVQAPDAAKAETQQAAPLDRTTVKTIAIDTVKGVRYLLTKGEQTMRIRLVPESLGELRLVVTSSSDSITVQLASANHTVREMLHTQVQHLREALTQDGANVGKITVTADMSAGTGNPNTGSPDRAWNPNARGWAGNSAASPKYPSAMGQQPVVVPQHAVPHAGALNLFA